MVSGCVRLRRRRKGRRKEGTSRAFARNKSFLSENILHVVCLPVGQNAHSLVATTNRQNRSFYVVLSIRFDLSRALYCQQVVQLQRVMGHYCR